MFYIVKLLLLGFGSTDPRKKLLAVLVLVIVFHSIIQDFVEHNILDSNSPWFIPLQFCGYKATSITLHIIINQISKPFILDEI